MKALYTFLVEYDGGTYCSQFTASSVKEAIKLYNSSDLFEPEAGPIDEDMTLLEDTVNVWCTSCISKKTDKQILANIIKTDTRT